MLHLYTLVVSAKKELTTTFTSSYHRHHQEQNTELISRLQIQSFLHSHKGCHTSLCLGVFIQEF